MNETLSNASALPFSPMPAYKDRRGWLIAFGIVEILISCFFLLMVLGAGLMALAIPNIPKVQGQPQAPGWLFLFIAGFYMFFAAVFAAAGIGSIQAKNWARILMIALSCLWLAFGVMGTLGLALGMPMMLHQQQAILGQNPAMQQAQLPPNFLTIVMAVALVFQVLIMIVLPLIFLIFYTRKSVKATCERLWTPLSPVPALAFVPSASPVSAGGAVSAPMPGPLVATSAARGLPIPVIVAMIWFAIVAVSGFMTALSFPLAIFFGVKFQGLEARLILLLFAAVNAFCAWSFYKRQIAGWWTAVAVAAFSALSGLVSVIRMDATSFSGFYDDIYRKMGIDPQQARVFAPDPHMIAVFQWVGWLAAVAFLAFVIFTRRYFPANPSKP